MSQLKATPFFDDVFPKPRPSSMTWLPPHFARGSTYTLPRPPQHAQMPLGRLKMRATPDFCRSWAGAAPDLRITLERHGIRHRHRARYCGERGARPRRRPADQQWLR